MSTIIGNLRVILGLDSAAFQKGLDDSVGRLRSVGQRMQRVGMDLSKRVTAPLVAVGAAATAAFLSSTNQLSELQRQADIAGMSVQQFKIAALAVREYGVSQEKLSDILKDVNDKFGDYIATGKGPLADFFDNVAPKVGVTIDSFKELSSSDALALYVTSLEKANVSQAEMTFYMEALANDATGLVPAFRDGGAAIAAMDKRARDLGLSLDDNLIKSARQTQTDFQIVADVMKIQFQQAMIGLAPVITQLLQALIPMLDYVRMGAVWFTDLVQRMSETNPQTLAWVVGLTMAAAAIGPVLAGVGLMITGLLSLAGSFTKVVLGIRAVTAALIANPIGIAVAAIAGGAFLIWKNWEQVGPWFKGLFASLSQYVGGFFQVLTGLFTGDLAQVVEGFKNIWSGFQATWKALWDGIVGILTFAWENAIKPITDALGITKPILVAWTAVQTMFTTVLDAIGAAFEAVKARIEPVVTFLKDAYDAAETGPNRVTGASKGPISSGYDPNADRGNDVIAPPVPSSVGSDVAGGYAEGVNAGLGDAYGAGVALGQATEQGLRDQTETRSPSKLFARLGSYLADGLSLGMDQQAPKVGASAGELGQSVSDGILPYFANVTKGAESLGDVFDNVKQAFGNMVSDMASRAMSSGLSNIVGSIFGGLKIPGFATGVDHFRGGMAMINERGGELAIMPSGSTVIPHGLSKRLLDRNTGNSATSLSMVIDLRGTTGEKALDDKIYAAGQKILSQVPAYIDEFNHRDR